MCCVDDNECDSSAACPPGLQCVNTPGSYACKCQSGFRANGTRCQGNLHSVHHCRPSLLPATNCHHRHQHLHLNNHFPRQTGSTSCLSALPYQCQKRVFRDMFFTIVVRYFRRSTSPISKPNLALTLLTQNLTLLTITLLTLSPDPKP